jgi:hypothetical protein
MLQSTNDAAAALTDFGWFWDQETFLPYCESGGRSGGNERERRDSNPRPPA